MESDSPSAGTWAQGSSGPPGEMAGRSTQPASLNHAEVKVALSNGFGEHRLRWATKQKEPACPQPPSGNFK
eukprot:378228-Alexandrium_andersonii.AAC.1